MDVSQLNKERKEAVTELGEHVLLLAPVGTSKTDTPLFPVFSV